jgi:hypothetical protein
MRRVAYLALAVAVLSSAMSRTAIAETRSIALPGLRAFPESLTSFFFGPARRKSSPSLPFRIYAVPLVGDQTR